MFTPLWRGTAIFVLQRQTVWRQLDHKPASFECPVPPTIEHCGGLQCLKALITAPPPGNLNETVVRAVVGSWTSAPGVFAFSGQRDRSCPKNMFLIWCRVTFLKPGRRDRMRIPIGTLKRGEEERKREFRWPGSTRKVPNGRRCQVRLGCRSQ